MSKKMKYTAPEINTEKIDVGVFGSYGSKDCGGHYNHDFWKTFFRKERRGRHN